MKAVVMAGGEGSRLRPLTSQFPKPLVPVVGTPIIEHILRLLRDHGITEVVLTLAYLGADIRNRLGDGSDWDMSIEYVVEDKPLGTAGSVRNAAHLLDGTFLVISGDALTDIDLTWAVAEHRRAESLATIVLKSVPNPLEYGVVVIDDEGHVRQLLEKPSWGDVYSDRANTGIYVLEPEVLEMMKPGQVADWSRDIFPKMLRRQSALNGIVADGYWCDIGNIETYVQANWDALDGKVKCHIPGKREGNVWMGRDVEMGDDVILDGPAFIGDEVKLKAGAHVNDHAVIDKYVVIENNAKVSNTIIWPHAYVGEGSRCRQSIICRSVTLKNNCFLEDNTVVGDECVVGRGAHIRAGVKIWPHKEIEPGSTVHESIVWAGGWRRGLFTAYGLGGLINVELTPEFCARLGAAFGATLPKGATVAVARDHARSSRMVKRAMVSGIVSAGARVRDLSELPVPVTQFSALVGNCAGAVHILVSPLDQRSVDIRFFDGDGIPIDKQAERRLENLFFREDFRRAAFYEMGEIERSDSIEHYRERLLSSVDTASIGNAGVRVLIDYDYSITSLILPDALSRLGVQVVPLNAGLREVQPHDGMPEETALISRTIKAGVGVLMGSTGESLYVVDDEGVVLDQYQLLAILARWQLQRIAGSVVVPALAPAWLGQVIESAGGTLILAKSDPTSLLRAASTPGTVFAGDGWGRFIWPDHLVAFDAMCSVVRLVDRLASSNEPLSAARKSLPTGAYVTATEYCPWETKGLVMRLLLEEHRDRAVNLVDGIKVDVDDGFVLVRPDPDAPNYEIIASMGDPARAQTSVEEYAARIRAARDSAGVVVRAPAVDRP